MEDHAALLRRAATKARETAQAATEGPWTNLDRGDRLVHLRDDGEFEYVVGEPMEHEGNADHIALWHPGVALAVATWLEDAALAAEENRDGWPEASYQKDPDWYENLFASEFHHPLAVARALLNHPEDT